MGTFAITMLSGIGFMFLTFFLYPVVQPPMERWWANLFQENAEKRISKLEKDIKRFDKWEQNNLAFIIQFLRRGFAVLVLFILSIYVTLCASAFINMFLMIGLTNPEIVAEINRTLFNPATAPTASFGGIIVGFILGMVSGAFILLPTLSLMKITREAYILNDYPKYKNKWLEEINTLTKKYKLNRGELI